MKLPKAKGKYDGLLGAIEQKDVSTQVQKDSKTQAPKPKKTQVKRKSSTKTPSDVSTQEPKKQSRNQLLKQGKMKQVKLILETEVYKHFRMACIDRNIDMSEVAEGLIQDWLVTYERTK